jgi:hypothetical protein
MYLFFGKNQVRARAELRIGTHRAESELFLFFFVSSVYSVPSQLLASSRELSSFAVREACCSQKLPAQSLLLTELSSFQYPPNLCARKACCSQSSPRSASYTNHTLFRRTELWKPFVAEPQKQSMNSLPSLAAVAGQPLSSAPVARQSAPIAGQPLLLAPVAGQSAPIAGQSPSLAAVDGQSLPFSIYNIDVR